MSNPIGTLFVTPASVNASEIILLMSYPGVACYPGLGAYVSSGTVVIKGCMVERRVGIDVECNAIIR